MNPTPEQLRTGGNFRLLETLSHQDILYFVMEYYRRRKSPVVWFHYAASLLSIAAWVWAGIRTSPGFNAYLLQIGWAVLAFIPLLAVHEAIHGMVYWLHGARDVRFGGSFRQLILYAIAHNFVADRVTFQRVAYAPFIVISLGLVVAAWVFPAQQAWLLGALALHTGGCAGDFAMMNYYALHKDRVLYTYDDADLKLSYIYSEELLTSGGSAEPSAQ